MRLFAQRALERKEPLPISISIGTHPFEITGSGYRAPLGVDEMAIAGGLRGEAVELAPCETIDVPYIADAEIVLEAEILPTGWTWPEGRFGEFTRLMGGLHWNPLVRIKAIAMRKDAIYYNLHMPWENTWLAAPTRYTAIRQALKTAGVQVKDINVTLGGCAFWHAVISIKKRGRRRQERAARGAVGDGPQARRGGRRRHRRQQSDRRRMGDRHARAGRQGRHHRSRRARQAARPEPACKARAWCRPAPRSASTRPSRRHPEGALRAHHLRLCRHGEGRRLRQGQEGHDRQVRRRARGGVAGGQDPAPRSRRSRCTTPTSPSGSRTTTSTPWRARSAICTQTEKLWQDPRGRMCVRGSKFAAVLPVEGES